jgi:hypothetical protein
MLVRVVTELKTCYIYKAVLRTIKVACRNLSDASNFIRNTTKTGRMTITFGSLMFATGEDENLKMLLPGPAPEHLTMVYEQAPCFLAISSITDGACLGLDPYAGLHIRTVKLIRDIPIVTSILQPSAGASSSSSSTVSAEQDSTDDYPEIRGSTCGDSTEEGHLIVMVASTRGPS